MEMCHESSVHPVSPPTHKPGTFGPALRWTIFLSGTQFHGHNRIVRPFGQRVVINGDVPVSQLAQQKRIQRRRHATTAIDNDPASWVGANIGEGPGNLGGSVDLQGLGILQGGRGHINTARDAPGTTVAIICTLMNVGGQRVCLLYTSPSPRDGLLSRMPSSA